MWVKDEALAPTTTSPTELEKDASMMEHDESFGLMQFEQELEKI